MLRRWASIETKKSRTAAVPWCSKGAGGIRTHTSSVSSAITASTSPVVNASTKRSSSTCSACRSGRAEAEARRIWRAIRARLSALVTASSLVPRRSATSRAR